MLALGLVSGRASRQSVQIEVTAPNEPLDLVADSEQIRQVLLNLLLNALDAVTSGGKVHVQVRRTQSGNSLARDESASTNSMAHDNWVHIQVEDTGSGLPAEIATRIFEPFVSSKDTGTGLGLTVSKRIVEAHAGQIEATNRPEGGAVFTVRLPIDAAGE